MQLSVILPTYNEKENIRGLILAVSGSISPMPEIIVVDDNSPDGTWGIVADLQKEMPNLKLCRRMKERGLATAVMEGIRCSSGDYLTWMDCDFSHPPALIPVMAQAMEEAGVAIASRYVAGGGQQYPLIRDITSRLFNCYARLILNHSIRDWTSGYIMLKREVIAKVAIEPLGKGYGEYFVGLLYGALKCGFKIKEIPYVCVYNRNHESKTSTSLTKLAGFGISYGTSVLKLKFRRKRGNHDSNS